MSIIGFRNRNKWTPEMEALEHETREWDALLAEEPPAPTWVERLIDLSFVVVPGLALIALATWAISALIF